MHHPCRGVFWDKKTRRWRCQLGYQSKKIFLGYFDEAADAAKAYDAKLVELRGAAGVHVSMTAPSWARCFNLLLGHHEHC